MKKTLVTKIMLALGVFGIITTEIGIVGVLPELAKRSDISISQAGLLVGVFALVVAVSGPFGVLIASRFNSRAVLLITMAAFALSNVVYAVSDNFPLLVVFRIIPALLHPIYFSVALALATTLEQPNRPDSGAARVFAGVTVGFAFGVPALSFCANHFSLSAAFAAVTLVNIIAFIGIAMWVPSMPADNKMTYGHQLKILTRPRVWAQVIIVALVFAVMFSSYSYFADYLTGVSGIPATIVGGLLLVFGLIMIAGNFIFARLIRASLAGTLLAFLALYLLLYLIIVLVAPSAWAVALLVLPWSLIDSGGLILGQSLIAKEATDAPTFGNSLFVSASNIGVTLGSVLGAVQIAWTGTRSLMLVGIALTLLALLAVTWSRTLRPREASTVSAQEEHQDAAS